MVDHRFISSWWILFLGSQIRFAGSTTPAEPYGDEDDYDDLKIDDEVNEEDCDDELEQEE